MRRKENYLQLIKSKLPVFMPIMECSIFQQDNARCHTAKICMAWLQDNFQVLDWPGNSPDLNPIENLWVNIKRKISERKPQNLDELKENIKTVWTCDVTPELCKNLVYSMPNRIKNVILNKGYPTKYYI